MPHPLPHERLRKADVLKRWRLDNGLNYAQAAAHLGVSIREYGMRECAVTSEELATGDYPSTILTKRQPAR